MENDKDVGDAPLTDERQLLQRIAAATERQMCEAGARQFRQEARAILAAASPVRPEPDWESRAMFVARLQAVHKNAIVSPNWVLNLLDDCDRCAQANATPTGDTSEKVTK